MPEWFEKACIRQVKISDLIPTLSFLYAETSSSGIKQADFDVLIPILSFEYVETNLSGIKQAKIFDLILLSLHNAYISLAS